MAVITSAIVGGLAAIGAGSAVAGGLLVAGAAATAGSLYYSSRAAKQQKKANEFQRRQANLQAAKQRRDLIRQDRLERSAAVLNAEAQNASTSSGARGGQDSILSQGYGNLSFMDTMNILSDQASKAYGKAIGYGNTANMFGGIASLAMSFYNPPVKASEAVKAAGPSPAQYRGMARPIPQTNTIGGLFGKTLYTMNTRP